MSLWANGIVRSRDKLKPSCLHYHTTHGHETWKDGDLLWAALTHEVTLPFDQVVFARSREKLKTYLYYHNTYINQTWEGAEIQWGASTHKVT